MNIIFHIISRIIRNYSRDSDSLELAVIEIVHEETRLPLICLSKTTVERKVGNSYLSQRRRYTEKADYASKKVTGEC